MSERAKAFADRLREARKGAGLSQYALAKAASLSKQAISRLELGDNEPSWQTVQLIAAALGVDCREFADPNVKPPPTVEANPRGRPRKVAAPEEPAKKPRRKKGDSSSTWAASED